MHLLQFSCTPTKHYQFVDHSKIACFQCRWLHRSTAVRSACGVSFAMAQSEEVDSGRVVEVGLLVLSNGGLYLERMAVKAHIKL